MDSSVVIIILLTLIMIFLTMLSMILAELFILIRENKLLKQTIEYFKIDTDFDFKNKEKFDEDFDDTENDKSKRLTSD